MRAQAARYTAAVLALAGLVAAAGALVVPADREGVAAGTGVAALAQVAGFWAFAVWLFPGRMWEAYGLGLLVRLAVFGVMAFWAVPALGLPFGATLFSMAGLFWVTTLLEPMFLKARTSNETQR